MKIKPSSDPDYWFLGAVIVLTFSGIMMLSSASSDLGQIKFGDSYYYLKHQIFYGLSLGILGFFLASRFYYRRWEKLSVWLLAGTILLLILVFTPLGFSAGGSKRWLALGPLTVQPAELLKFTFIVYLAAWLSAKPERPKSLTAGFLPFLITAGFISALLLAQPSTTTVAIVMVSSLAVYFLSGAKWRYVITTIFLGLIFIAAIIYSTPYRFQRVAAFLDPSIDYQDSNYHLNQALIAIGAGGLWGVGYGQSTTKFNYLPEPIGDSIFAVIAEEFGFAGAVSLIAIYLFLMYRGFSIALRSRDMFAKLLVGGLCSVVGFQAFFNMGAISGLLPVTGVPLPFISYGGTALAVFLTMMGVIINVSRHRI